MTYKKTNENKIEGRNAVLEAFRSGKTIDKLYILDGCQDGPVRTIAREAKKHDTIINYVKKERLDQLSETGKHQGVIAVAASYEYVEVEDILENARKKGEPPFIILLDNIEDPHNLGAIIRTATHLSTLCNQMVNCLGIMQNEWAGAQAFSSFDTYLSPFVKASTHHVDCPLDYSGRAPDL